MGVTKTNKPTMENRIMKTTLIAIVLSSLSLTGLTRADETSSPDALVWCGLDYSMVKMIGTDDFRVPEEIFPGYLDKWNALFMKEMLPKLEAMTNPVYTDTMAVEKPNHKATTSQIIREDGTKDEMVKPSHITEKNIADEVKGYEIKYKEGLGLVFVMDRLVKTQNTGCMYVVFFDVASRKVISSERMCTEARGAGFRNFWFNPIKEVVKKLPKMYKDAKAKK